MGQLISIDIAKRQVALTTDFDELKDLRDKAEALRLYAKKAGEGLKQQNLCAEIKIRAERRCGELLPNQIEHGGNRISKPRLANLTLKDLGISKYQSHCWQSIAKIPDDIFEAHIAKVKSKNSELTTASLLRIAKEQRKIDKDLRKAIIPDDLSPMTERFELIHGKFQEMVLEPASIDIIITGPPYDKKHLSLYKDLAIFAADVLKPGGSLGNVRIILSAGNTYVDGSAYKLSLDANLFYPRVNFANVAEKDYVLLESGNLVCQREIWWRLDQGCLQVKWAGQRTSQNGAIGIRYG